MHQTAHFENVLPGRVAMASFERPLDLVHLARQTLGDAALEAEVLALFVTQSTAMVARIHAAGGADERRALAHTLKGSARAIGAWRVAVAAETVEQLGDEAPEALADLAASVREACLTIHALASAR